MKIVKCRTQEELDAALKNPDTWPELIGGGEFEIYGSAQVRAYDSAQVTAGKCVAVTISSDYVKADGGVQIRYQPPCDVAAWLDEYGVEVNEGVAILFKAVDSEFNSQRGTSYAPGLTPESDGWDEHECSHGLHFCGTPHHALNFFDDAKRFVGCPVRVEEILFIPDGTYPTKVKARRVEKPGCFEVDIHGNKI